MSDLRTRLEALDLYLIWDQLGQTHNNPGLLIQEIVDANDTARVDQIEADYNTKYTEVQAREAQEELARLGRERQETGKDISAYMNTILDNKTFTTEQQNAFLADEDLKNIDRLLLNGSLDLVRPLIVAYAPNTILLQEDLDNILSYFDYKRS